MDNISYSLGLPHYPRMILVVMLSILIHVPVTLPSFQQQQMQWDNKSYAIKISGLRTYIVVLQSLDSN